MNLIDTIAMWVGYAVMAAGAASSVALLLGVACTYSYRTLLRDVPSWLYIQNAVALYRKQYPPSRWAREQMNKDWP
ncbi:hypothetical protein [Aquabacterium sp. OR-4]|uniref:hypothetical protein n=1 Tax=Aquabacterium sp. OR-4 TaxID=2978127 RepID=UPI0021B3DEA1|nr:hypothetical protein [Aquabacterium sp. OR-4]MDT7834964.1 hypothetical protein [Aquabacterium sp. OR-4]